MAVFAASWATVHLWGGAVGDEPFFLFAGLPVIYSLGAHPSLERALAGAGILLVAVATTDVRSFMFFALQLALLWLSGRGARIYRAQSNRLRALATQLEGEREACERLAVAEERQRMAAELHDTIAHTVSLMVIQAGGAGQTIGRQPDRARAALIAVQGTGRQAIAELRRVLHLLRDTQDTPNVEPALPPPVVAPARRRLTRFPVWGDLLLAVCLVLAPDVRLLFGDVASGLRLMVMVFAAVACLAIAIRRRVPLTALTIAAATTVAELQLDAQSMGLAPVIATMVAMYSVAAHTVTRRSVPAAVIATLSIAVQVLINVGGDSFVVAIVWLAIPWFGGRSVRAYRHQAEQLQTLTIRLGRERDALARLAVINERARVARDLHDSVAHTVSVMVLQAAAAEQVMDTSPDRARVAILAVENQGRQALVDLQYLLGLLDCCGAVPRAPQPSVARLDTLLAQVAWAGLPITLRVHGQPARLPTGLDISAYRIVQEGLTNTLKHAGPVPTTVTLDYQPDALAIEIRDPGTGRPPQPADHSGHGLLGMRERIALYGGTLETGPCASGGFTVRAHLPLDPAPT